MSHRVTIFYDFSSPFSYLGSTQITALCQRHGAELTWHPLLLGALFKEIGTPMVPMMAISHQKRRHALLDLARFAHQWGVPFRWPSRFPIRTVAALRFVLAAQEVSTAQAACLTARLYRAAWAEDRDIADPAILEALAEEVGLDGVALLARTTASDLKQKLFEQTRQAKEAGVFGVPTFLIDGEELIWGQDRLALVEWCLST